MNSHRTKCSNITLNRRAAIGTMIFMTATFIIIYSYQNINNTPNIVANLDIEIESTVTTIESTVTIIESTATIQLAAAVVNHPKWIVVTTISLPTEDLKKLVAIQDWKVVVVGDTKTPSNWSFPDAYYLNIEQQQQLGYKITKRLPYNSYTRKMIGYLFAVHNGAQFIYDTDDDNHPTGGKIDFHQQPTMSGLIYDDVSKPVVNPLDHFGQPQLWPRGYPLESVAIKANRSYQLCTFRTPAIQQGLVNGDPDVDAIYRLLNKGSATNKSINITFDEHAPPMTLPSGVFAPFNSQNTFFAYEAFWSLFLPTTVDFRVTDIWRGYWAQRLLWLIGQNLAFFPPNAIQFRNAHSYLKDFAEEIQIYEDAGKLIQFLSQWECSSNPSFFSCISQLTSDMAKNGFLKEEDSALVQLWLEDLISVGYKEPSLKTTPLHDMCTNEANWVYYSPPITNPNKGFRDLFSFCENDFKNSSALKKEFSAYLDPVSTKEPSYNFNNILLVIVFNFPHIGNARMLEALYRDHFPNILICSEANSISDFKKEISSSGMPWRTNDISFVNIVSNGGWYGYECAIRAIEMNYKVDGYMFLGDDILFKLWKTVPFDVGRSRIQNDTYGPHSYQNRSDEKCSSRPWDPWWARECGYISTNKVLDEIELISKNSSDTRAGLFQQYINNCYANNVNMTLVSYSMSDFYYISQIDSMMFSQVIRIFLKHKVYLDIAVPTTLQGCRPGEPQTNDGFLGISVWGGNRNVPLNFFTNDSIYVHPLKIKQLLPDTDLLKSYCRDYIAEYLNHW